jgi:monoamine oxidase
LGLVRELELETISGGAAGEKLFDYRGRLRRYDGELPRLPVMSALELRFTLSRIDKLRAQVPLSHPSAAGMAGEWDGVTVESFKRSLKTRAVRSLLDAALGALYGAEAGELSLLGLLYQLNASQGLLKPVRGGGGELRLARGAQEIATRLAARLGERIRLSAPVRAIEQDGSAVMVHSDVGSHRARRCIVALPPLLAGRIRYTPSLPAARDQLTQRMPMGHMTKVIAIYDSPFWRKSGLCGQVVSDRGPVRVCLEESRGEERAVLIGVVAGDDARRFSRLSPADRRNRALDCLARWFGEAARRPRTYIEKDWAEDPWSAGGPVALLSPGTLTRYGASLREPVGRIHWAGSETSTAWCGYMEGAIASGERAANEVQKGNHHA